MARRLTGAIFAAWLVLASHAGPAAAQAGGGGMTDSVSTVRGRVLDHATGSPIAGAIVSFAAGPRGTPAIGTRMSDQRGEFRFDSVPAGTYSVNVHALSYLLLTDTLLVAADSDIRVILTLSASPMQLEPVVVTTRRRLWFMTGFEDRRAHRKGLSAFFARDEIEARNPRFITDVVDMVPNARVVRVGALGNDLTVGRGCRPAVWIDGDRMLDLERPVSREYNPIGLDAHIPPDEVEALELYTTGHDVPAEFAPSPCGALVIWTRPAPPEERAPEWRRWLMAIGIFGAALLLVR